jgi:hypothetical protein
MSGGVQIRGSVEPTIGAASRAMVTGSARSGRFSRARSGRFSRAGRWTSRSAAPCSAALAQLVERGRGRGLLGALECFLARGRGHLQRGEGGEELGAEFGEGVAEFVGPVGVVVEVGGVEEGEVGDGAVADVEGFELVQACRTESVRLMRGSPRGLGM